MPYIGKKWQLFGLLRSNVLWVMWWHPQFQIRKEGNVLFNNALNTFYLWLYGIRHMVKYHTYSERGNPLPPHGLLFLINSKGSFICTIPQTGLHIPRPLLYQSWSTGWTIPNKKTSSPKRYEFLWCHFCSYLGVSRYKNAKLSEFVGNSLHCGVIKTSYVIQYKGSLS